MGRGLAFQAVGKSRLRSAQHSWNEIPAIAQRLTPQTQNLPQRKPGTCTCDGGCPHCAQPQSLRTNLAISQPGDGLEREADLLAETVMRMPDSVVAAVRRSTEPPLVQRLCAECDEELHRKAGPGPERVGEGFKHPSSGGRPLSDFERRFFEPRFGRDLSNVRVHEGRQAAEAASSVNALAYALQNDIVFGEGQYLPSTSSGRALLAHELTHVVQQGASQHLGTVAAVAPMIQRAPVVEDEALCAGTAFPPAPVWFTDPLLVRIRIDEALMAFGSVGEPVALVQQALVAWGCDEGLGHLLPQFGVDGIFGNETRAAVKTFQTQQSIDDDGIVGPITMGELDRFVLGGVWECPSGTTASAFVSESQPLQTVCLPLGIPPIPLGKGCPTPSKSGITGSHVAEDPFSGRSLTRYGVEEKVNLSFDTERPELKALPTEKRATFFGGGRWVKKSGPGSVNLTIPDDLNAGKGTFTADENSGKVELELQVEVGPCKGSAVAEVQFEIVRPDGVNMTEVPGTAPNFGGFGKPTITKQVWGAGFLASVFIDPKDVSFKDVDFGEGKGTIQVTPVPSFLDPFDGDEHQPGAVAPGGKGNKTTGTPVLSPGDQVVLSQPTEFRDGQTCGNSDLLWPIEWRFSVGGSAPDKFATATVHATSDVNCDATVEKAGAGPFCRRLDDTDCTVKKP